LTVRAGFYSIAYVESVRITLEGVELSGAIGSLAEHQNTEIPKHQI
jgi:hypothetical protein